MVELKVDGEIGGVRVRGWIDLLDVEGRVIDIKTAKARPSSIEPMPLKVKQFQAQQGVVPGSLFVTAVVEQTIFACLPQSMIWLGIEGASPKVMGAGNRAHWGLTLCLAGR